MTFAILTVASLVCMTVAVLLLRSLGVRYRVGRLLAAAPLVDIDVARELATTDVRYVRVTAASPSEEEFPDETTAHSCIAVSASRSAPAEGRGASSPMSARPCPSASRHADRVHRRRREPRSPMASSRSRANRRACSPTFRQSSRSRGRRSCLRTGLSGTPVSNRSRPSSMRRSVARRCC